MLEEMKNLNNSEMLRKYLSLLDEDENFNISEFTQMAQNGYCEDLCVYFFFKYPKENIEIFEVNNAHFVFKYQGKFYDSLSPEGVEDINLINYFKDTEIKSVRKWNESELPRYYIEKWQELQEKEIYEK